MDKDAVCEVLERIAQLLELKGENPFKVRAYTNASAALANYAGSLSTAVEDGTLAEIPGLGKAIAAKVTELVETGNLAYVEELLSEFPPGIFDLLSIPGLGPKKVRVLVETLKVGSVAELEAAVKDGRVADLPGFGEKTAGKILDGIQQLAKYAGTYLRYQVAQDLEILLDLLRDVDGVWQVSVAGSYRRARELIHDLDIIVAASDGGRIIDEFVNMSPVAEVIAKGDTKCSVRLHSGIQTDLRVVSNEEFGCALAYFTGSKQHNIKMRSRAQERGWTLNEYRLAPDEEKKGDFDKPPRVFDEPSLYAALGLDYVPPELREDTGEFDAAEKGALPRLIELSNLRGTFHVHTTASDGRGTLMEMVRRAHELGLQYVGISDHSKSSFQANGLDESRLADQIADIALANAEFGADFRIFSGIECDILRDGALDFSTEILSRLDFVVASVHASFQLPEAEMTKRIIRAISNPCVTMLGHISGRLLLSREPYKVDIAAVIEAAGETGTVIELNCSPQRLELDWRWWPLAKEKGVKCSINPDAHRVDAFGYLAHGVELARKGWLTRDDVINTLPLGKIEQALNAKRRNAKA